MEYDALRFWLGRTIKSERVKLGYSQEGFANAAGLHRTFMGAIERGESNLSLHSLFRIAGALGVTLSDLIAEAEGLAASRGEG